jgi:RNA polymerase sigma-70 factor (ECF subfamily)
MSLAPVPAVLAPLEERGSASPSGPGADEELVARIAQGDREAFRELYDRYETVLLALAQRLLRSPSDAEDLVHDVCLEIWRQAHTYERSRGTVRTWLVMRLRSRALDRIRSSGRLQLETSDENHAEEAAAPDVDLALRFDCSRVQRALSELPEEQRSVLVLAYFEGLPLPEIGERLAIPVGTAKSRLSRALGRLREDLDA